MQNYSNVFAETLAEFVSPIVPADQGDNGKGQVCARAAYKINTTMNPQVGHIGKNPGQTQYPTPYIDGLRGIAVDALIDKSDGTGADYLTDVDLGNGTREIRVAYTPYAPPPAGSDPAANYVPPSTQYRDLPGPLTLKTPDSGGGDGGGTDPLPPPADYTEVLSALDDIASTLATMQVQQETDTATILARDDANAAKGMQQISDLVEDVEESLMDALKVVIILLRRRDDPEAATAAVDDLRGRMMARRQARRDARRDARRI